MLFLIQKAGPFLQEPAGCLGQTIISAQLLAGKAAPRCPPVAGEVVPPEKLKNKAIREGSFAEHVVGAVREREGEPTAHRPPPTPTLLFAVQVDLGNHGNRE